MNTSNQKAEGHRIACIIAYMGHWVNHHSCRLTPFQKAYKMVAWTQEREIARVVLAPFERVVYGSRKALVSTVATLSKGVSLLSRLRQPLMRKQRSQYAGIMEMRPRHHTSGLSSLIPALVIKLQMHRDASLRSPEQRRVGIVSRVIGPGPSSHSFVGWMLSGMQATCCNDSGGRKPQCLRRERHCGRNKRRHLMTKLEANIKDFHVIRNEQDEIICYRFRFGQCDEFATTFKDFKSRIALEDRIPDPDANWLWEVKASKMNNGILRDMFDNFEQCLTIVESQMRLFGI